MGSKGSKIEKKKNQFFGLTSRWNREASDEK